MTVLHVLWRYAVTSRYSAEKGALNAVALHAPFFLQLSLRFEGKGMWTQSR